MRMVMMICGIALLASGAADARRKAEESRSAEVAPVQELARCKALTDDSQRLACYDKATTALLAAEQKADIIVVDRTEVESTRRSLFGFSLPDISLFKRHGAQMEQIDHIEGAIDTASGDASGQWTFRLADGSVWKQVDTNSLPRSPRPGDAVVVKRAALGSYMLSVSKWPGVKVRRIG